MEFLMDITPCTPVPLIEIYGHVIPFVRTLCRNVRTCSSASIRACDSASILVHTSVCLCVCARASASIRAHAPMSIRVCGGYYKFLSVFIYNIQRLSNIL